MDALSVSEGRLRALFEAGLAVTSELSLEALLRRLVEAAAELTGARYAALGVIDASGSELEQFITHGIDDGLRAEIGALPRGRGILGVLIREAKPLRLHDLAEDPRSVGFPPGHPPMHSFLGVPIMLRGVAYGNLYLTEKQDGEDFTDEDEELVTLLAGQAAVAIENARLYEASSPLVAPAPVAERGRKRARYRDRSRPPARPRRAAPARTGGSARRRARAAERR